MLTIEMEDLNEDFHGDRIKKVTRLLNDQDLIDRASKKSFFTKFPIQKSVDCVGNSLANALGYIWEEVPFVLDIDLESEARFSEGSKRHNEFIQNFLNQTSPPPGREGTSFRSLSDVRTFLQNSPDNELCQSFIVENEVQAIEKLADAQGRAALIQGANGHATMLYARKKNAQLEIVEIDSLVGKEKVLPPNEFIAKMYPNNGQYDPMTYWVGIETLPLETSVKKRIDITLD